MEGEGRPPTEEGSTKGPEGEVWASWLVQDKKELDDIGNESLRTEIRLLARKPESMVGPERLESVHDRIDELIRTGQIQDSEAAFWQGRIASRHQELMEKQEGSESREGLLGKLATGVGAGIPVAVGEAGEKIGEAIAERIRGKGRKEREGGEGGGEGGEPPKKPPAEPPKEKGELPDDFLHLQQIILNNETPEDLRKRAMEKRDEMMSEFREKEPELFDEYTQTIMNTLKDSDWNHVKQNIAKLADNLENEYQGIGGFNSKWEGMIRAAVIGESLRISKTGFDKRPTIDTDEDSGWMERHGMREGSFERLNKRVEREAFFPLGVNPHEFIGASLYSTPIPKEINDVLEGRVERREVGSAMIPPNEVVAVFEQGRLGIFKDAWKGKVEFLDITDDVDRNRWALLNMRAFNGGIIAEPHLKWRGTINYWLTDLSDSASLARLDRETSDDVEQTNMLIRSMMAVSASARAMEPSGGASSDYVAVITASEKGDLSRQDSWEDLLLHNDPEKYDTVINHPLVKYYYQRLMQDAGLSSDPKYEWHRKEGKGKWVLRQIMFNNEDEGKGIREARKGKLVGYLKEKADEGGFNAYIKKELLGVDPSGTAAELGVTNDMRWSAARLACDAFLVDKFTEWEYKITGGSRTDDELRNFMSGAAGIDNPDPESEEDTDKLRMGSIYPFKGWGGDPLRAILQPSFLPRVIKGVYKSEGDRVILDMFDDAFRPEDIFNNQNKAREYLPPTMVGHLKHYARHSEALFTVLGDSQAGALPLWSRKTMEDELMSVASLLNQVYGNKNDKQDVPNLGKHIVGAMMARILHTKALAAAVESPKPGFPQKAREIFDPKGGRPFSDVKQYLWGLNLDNVRSFLGSLTGPRFRLVLEGNAFGANADIKAVQGILTTSEQDMDARKRFGNRRLLGFALSLAARMSEKR